MCEKDVLTIFCLKRDLQEFLEHEKQGFAEPESETEIVKQSGENPQHVGIINNFANAILQLEPLYVDGRDGLKCVELMDSMLLSAWEDKAVELPVNDDLYYKELKKRIASSKDKAGESILIDNTMSFGRT